MRTEALAEATAPWMPALAFLLFVLAFLCLTWPVFRKGKKGYWEKMARMPLEQHDQEER